jgi:hypothetical protein
MIIVDNSYYSARAPSATVSLTGVSTGVGIRNVTQAEPLSNRLYIKNVQRGSVVTLKKLAEQGTTTKSISSLTGGGTTTVTATMATSNTLAEINVYAGDYVIIQGASVTAHNGLHRILTASGTGGTSFTFQTAATTTASTGTITVRRAESWSISGGFVDSN